MSTTSVPQTGLRVPALRGPDLYADAISLLADLVRIDTSNPGGQERPAAEYVAERLAEVGIESRVYECDSGRSNLVARVQGVGSEADALVVHGHLDVVPADPAEWRHHPFSGELAEGCLWGRGAVDMKNMIAMVLAVVRKMARTGARPHHDLVLAFFADEEAGAQAGSGYLVRDHPELFEGASAAIGELGGFSATLPSGHRLYPIQIAEKGVVGLRARVRGQSGHASMPREDNCVVELAEAIARLGRHRFPLRLTSTTRALLAALETAGVPIDQVDGHALGALGTLWPWMEASLRNTACPTVMRGGSTPNVVPGEAEAIINCRFVPGGEEELLAEVLQLLGPNLQHDVMVSAPAVEAPWEHPLVTAMAAALRAEDPLAHPVPFMIPAATDAKNLSTLGLKCYGFAPLLLPAGFDFAAMFHGVDERVPLAALEFGSKVLYRLLTASWVSAR